MPGRVLFVIHDLHQSDIHYPAWAGCLTSSLKRAGAKCEVYDMAAHHYTNYQLAAHLDDNEYDLTEDEANKLIEDFHDLYFCGHADFRGSRHYEAWK